MKRQAAPVLFGRNMRRIRTYGFTDLYVLNAPPLSFTVWKNSGWKEAGGAWQGTVKVGATTLAERKHKSIGAVTDALESAVWKLSSKLLRLLGEAD